MSPERLFQPNIWICRGNCKAGIGIVLRRVSPDTASIATLFKDVDYVECFFGEEVSRDCVREVSLEACNVIL